MNQTPTINSVTTYIALGSNLDNPIQQIRNALIALTIIPQTHLINNSKLYRNPPMGSLAQPDFINAVAALATTLSAEQLLIQLQAIEQIHGRQRSIHWGPRTLDLDLLLYGDSCIQTATLQVPHPGLTQRNFFLYPLAEIAPDLRLPNGEILSALLTQCSNAGLEVVV